MTSRDEIGELASAFGRMVEELREKDRLVAYFRTRRRTDGDAAPRPTDGIARAGQRLRRAIRDRRGAGAGGDGRGVPGARPPARRGGRDQGAAARSSARSIRRVLERFKQELRLARRITHRNVVRTYDLGETAGTYYITMELVRGTTLAHLHPRGGAARRAARRSRSASSSAGRSRWRTRKASCTGTSSRRTCSWTRAGFSR